MRNRLKVSGVCFSFFFFSTWWFNITVGAWAVHFLAARQCSSKMGTGGRADSGTDASLWLQFAQLAGAEEASHRKADGFFLFFFSDQMIKGSLFQTWHAKWLVKECSKKKKKSLNQMWALFHVFSYLFIFKQQTRHLLSFWKKTKQKQWLWTKTCTEKLEDWH